MECVRCKSANRDDARFCAQCGTALSTARSDEQESERKQVTVLFADISGSTALISGLDPERAWSLLDPILQTMIEAVKTFGGTVAQIQGDGIMALIGAPVAQEDHALRACYAALRMHQMADQLVLPGYTGAPIRLHVGIATGETLVGMIGDELNRGYNAVGEIIHVAARLQSKASAGQTLCTGETGRQVADFVTTRSLGMVAIRGIAQPVEVVELEGANDATMRFHAAASRGLSKFRGRAPELATLRDAVARAVDRKGGTVAISGEAGIGKSRLVWELTRSVELAECLILETGCAFFAGNSPYLPIVELLRRYFKTDPLDSVDSNRWRVHSRLVALGGLPDGAEQAFLALLDLSPANGDWDRLEPPRRREAIESAFVNLILRLAMQTPVVFVVEDLHWVDQETHALLLRLATRIAEARVLLLVDYRPEHDLRWQPEGDCVRLGIEPLSHDAMVELADQMIGQDPSVAALKHDLVARMAGNPFFLEETVRALEDAGAIAGTRGHFRLLQETAALQTPSSVRAVLSARIDRLGAVEKRLLQGAATIGNAFAIPVLSAMFDDVTPEAVHRHVRQLADAGLIVETSLYPEPCCAFKHALTQEVTYEALPLGRRRQYHAMIVSAIENLYPTRSAEHVEELAYHAARGEVWDRLARHGRVAGQRAAARSAYRAAVQHFERAIDGFAHLEQTEAVVAEAITTRFELRSALYPLGEIARDLSHLRRAEALASGLSDRRLLAWVSAYIARDLALLGEPDQALKSSESALLLSRSIDDLDLHVLTRASIGQAHFALGNYALSARTLRGLLGDIATVDRKQRFGLPLPGHVIFRAWLVWSMSRMGDVAEAEPVMGELLQIAADSDQPLAQTVAQYSCGLALVNGDNLPGGIVYLEQALALCRRWDLTAWFTNVASCLGYAYARTGRIEPGLDLLRQAIERSQRLQLMISHSLEVAWYAEALLEAGHLGKATEEAARAVGLARTYKEGGNEAYALWVAAEAARRQGTVDQARLGQMLAEARARAEACGMRPLVARCDRLMAAPPVATPAPDIDIAATAN